MYKIGIIGEHSSVLCFMALGFTVLEANTPTAAAPLLHKLAQTGEYAAIFITETLAAALADDIARYKDAPLPAITVIPGADGATGYGMATVRDAVIRAVGADILFKNERD